MALQFLKKDLVLLETRWKARASRLPMRYSGRRDTALCGQFELPRVICCILAAILCSGEKFLLCRQKGQKEGTVQHPSSSYPLNTLLPAERQSLVKECLQNLDLLFPDVDTSPMSFCLSFEAVNLCPQNLEVLFVRVLQTCHGDAIAYVPFPLCTRPSQGQPLGHDYTY
jgi:hypothetical protein